MRLIRACAGVAAAAVLLAMPIVAGAQTCLLNGCPSPPNCASAKCPNPYPMFHGTQDICGNGGSFNLIGTQYESTCNNSGACTQSGMPPPLRFWTFNHFGTANSGCADKVTLQWLQNSKSDVPQGPVPGHWFLNQVDWNHPNVDGCGLADPEAVAEISDVYSSSENTTGHKSWYLIASTANDGTEFDFDLVSGATGCNTHDVVKADVPPVTVAGATCGNASKGTANADTSFFNVTLNLPAVPPSWYSEMGASKAPALIRGYEILYVKGAEPLFSNYTTGGWSPAFDATLTTNHAVVPITATGTVTVAVPTGAATDNYWFAERLVYEDTSSTPAPAVVINPTTPTVANPIHLASQVSAHCGPVNPPGGGPFVRFGSITAVRTPQGVKVSWTTLEQDDTVGFSVKRTTATVAKPELDAEVAFVDVQAGPSGSYAVVDSAAGPGTHYNYYVQEWSSNAPVTSEMASVQDSTGHDGPSGGRSRSHRNR